MSLRFTDESKFNGPQEPLPLLEERDKNVVTLSGWVTYPGGYGKRTITADEVWEVIEHLRDENATLRSTLAAIAGQRPEDSGTTRMSAAEFARITLRSLTPS